MTDFNHPFWPYEIQETPPMKSASEVNAARKKLIERIFTPGLSSHQQVLLTGMINALAWVAESKNSKTVEMLLTDAPMAVGADHTDVLSDLEAVLNSHR